MTMLSLNPHYEKMEHSSQLSDNIFRPVNDIYHQTKTMAPCSLEDKTTKWHIKCIQVQCGSSF